MNSRNNSDKDSKNSGWGRRDNRQQRFKKDFSGQDFYNQDWKNKPKKIPETPPPKVEKTFKVQENYYQLISKEFKWINYCIL